jgi:hypothetical protein
LFSVALPNVGFGRPITFTVFPVALTRDGDGQGGVGDAHVRIN